jgi:hypothetical protein
MSGNRRSRSAARPAASLDEIERLYIDGSNLLHRRGGTPTSGSSRTLLASLRVALPPTLDVVLLLDGQPDPGASSQERISPGLTVRYAGRVDADSVLVQMVSGQTYREALRTVVVTDDRALGDRVRRAGGRTERLDWLERLLHDAMSGGPRPQAPGGAAAAGPRGSSISSGRPPSPSRATGPEDMSATPWRPGRGATKKRGNPKRGHPPAEPRAGDG